MFSTPSPDEKASPLAGSGVGALAPLVVTENRLTGDEAVRWKALSRGALKGRAAWLLFNEPTMLATAGRVYQCGWGTFGKSVALVRAVNGSASFQGIKRCNSVWLCPECSARICALRCQEVNDLLTWAAWKQHTVVMLTLTAGHQRHDELGGSLDTFKLAKQMLRQRREWRRLTTCVGPFGPMLPLIIGTVTATEVTHGGNGWHVHTHELLVLRLSPIEANALIETLRQPWDACLARYGREGNRHAFQVQGASAAYQYVTKFGAAAELTLSGTKKGRRQGRNPTQLLAASLDGDAEAGALWLAYARAFKGRRQLVWSRGLKAACGVADIPDDDAGSAGVEAEIVREWEASSGRWREARRRRLAMLVAVATGSDLDAAEFGLTDIASFDAVREERRWRSLHGNEAQSG